MPCHIDHIDPALPHHEAALPLLQQILLTGSIVLPCAVMTIQGTVRKLRNRKGGKR